MATIPCSQAMPAPSHGLPAADLPGPQTLAELRDRVRRMERSNRRGGTLANGSAIAEGSSIADGDAAAAWRLSTGWPRLDRLLPAGGLERGTLCEWLSAGLGSGAAWLALRAAAEAAAVGGMVVVIDLARRFYPPAAVAAGLDLARTLLVHPDDAHNAHWAFDQALRCPGVAAVYGEVDELDDRTFRRWQLAAEAGGALGALVRPAMARRLPSWSECRFWVEPLGIAPPLMLSGQPPGFKAARPPDGRWRRWRVELLRGRGTQPGRAVILELGGASECGRARECSPDRPAVTRN